MATGYEKILAIKSKLKTAMTVEELAAALDCGPRTIFRHLELVQQENCGLRKFKQNGSTYYQIKTEKEVVYDQNTLRQLEKIHKTITGNSAADIKNRKLLEKLMDALKSTNPDDFKPEALTMDRNLILDYGPFSSSNFQETMVTKALTAIRDGFKIKISYTHTSRDIPSEVLEVSPVKVIHRVDTLYLVAADAEGEKNNTFKNFTFANISNITVTGTPVPKLAFDEKTHYKYAFGKYTKDELPVQEVQLLVKDKWLQMQFDKANFNPPAESRMDKNKNMVVTMKMRLTPDFKTWLLGIAPNIQILKPESLKKEIVEMAKSALSSLQGK